MQIINDQPNGKKRNTIFETNAFRYGEGFFTTTAVKKFVPIWLERHIHRLNESMADFDMGELYADQLSAVVYKWIRENRLEQGFLRIMTWNESGQVKVYLNGGALIDGGSQLIRLAISPYRRHSSQPLLAYKSFNYWINNLAYQQGVKQGCDETVFLNEKEEICEGSRTNIFWVNEGAIYTPDVSCGLLSGIGREIVLELAGELGIKVNMGCFHISELKKSREVFLTNSVRGIMGALPFENSRKPNKGIITGLISEAYNTWLDDYVRKI